MRSALELSKHRVYIASAEALLRDLAGGQATEEEEHIMETLRPEMVARIGKELGRGVLAREGQPAELPVSYEINIYESPDYPPVRSFDGRLEVAWTPPPTVIARGPSRAAPAYQGPPPQVAILGSGIGRGVRYSLKLESGQSVIVLVVAAHLSAGVAMIEGDGPFPGY